VKPIVILVVEDNPDHVLIIQRALALKNVVNVIAVARDGSEALDYLYRRGAFADPAKAPRPGLILLDIKLPKVNGLEVLQHIKNDAALRSIPVVMLTSSEQSVDISKCYLVGANSYVTKPVQFDAFMDKIQTLELYWALISEPPPDSAAPPARH
jgi:CheY-like chemotaxis protein